MGPPSQFGGGMGPGTTSSASRGDHRSTSTMNAGRGPPHLLTGPGSAGVHGESLSVKDRDRLERAEREKERERESRSAERREREMIREREREMYAIERDKQERVWERERREEERMRERGRREGNGAMIGMVGGDRSFEAEREREWQRKAHQGGTPRMQESHPGWPIFAPPRMSDDPGEAEKYRERDLAMQREAERAREHSRAREQMDADPVRADRIRQQEQQARREKDRSRDIDRDMRKERMREPRRVSGEEHGWLPDPRALEGWSREQERERERELEQQDRMRMQREFDIREREMRDREREEELLRNRHPVGLHHHHLHHHHHRHSAPTSVPPNVQGHGINPKSSAGKSSRPTELGEVALGQPIGPGALPPPFNSIINDRPPSHAGPKHVSSKISTGTAPGQPPLPSAPQHLHPSHHLHQHPHALPPQMGFPPSHRQSPVMKALTAPAISAALQAHSPHPPLPPTLEPRHLGTFVYPSIPFPFMDFSPLVSDTTVSAPSTGALFEREIREIHVTIFIPTGFLPAKRPKHPRIWGGAPIPSFSPLFFTPPLINHVQAGMPPVFPKPHRFELRGIRRVYTDDSDLFLCALHSGWITWSATRKARQDGKDLRLELRLTREARYVGGYGAKYIGNPDGQDGPSEDDGTVLLSAGWGNGHDGAGMEILKADFVQVGSLSASYFHSHSWVC